jgi:hypothetical protein
MYNTNLAFETMMSFMLFISKSTFDNTSHKNLDVLRYR